VGRMWLRRLRMLGWAVVMTASSAVCLVLFIVTVVAIPLFTVWVGIPMLLLAVEPPVRR
jgi:hypothetical protein